VYPRENLLPRASQLVLVTIWILSGSLQFSALAQSTNETGAKVDCRTTTVAKRARPELDPLGLRISGFVMHPSLGVDAEVNDNIFASQANKRDDLITTINPAVRI